MYYMYYVLFCNLRIKHRYCGNKHFCLGFIHLEQITPTTYSDKTMHVVLFNLFTHMYIEIYYYILTSNSQVQMKHLPILFFQLLHKNIDSIEKKENKPNSGIPQGGSLFLKCKDLRIFQLDIATSTELNFMAQTLENLSSLQDPTLFYPFFYRHMHPIMENGFTLYR